RSLRRVLMAVALWGFAGLGYAVFKLVVFGHLLPNPFYMKSGGGGFAGIDETGAFMNDYVALLVALVVCVLAWFASRRSATAAGTPPSADVTPMLALVVTAAWLLYSAKIVHEIGFAHRFAWS